MNCRTAILCLFTLLILAEFGEGIDTDCPPQETQQAEWTVMVYMNGKTELECDALENFGQMAQVGSTRDVNVLVELGLLPLQSNFSCPSVTEIPDWDGVHRYRVTQHILPMDRNACSDPGSRNDRDMGDPNGVVNFLKWSRLYYPARHYMLIIWGHGYEVGSQLDFILGRLVSPFPVSTIFFDGSEPQPSGSEESLWRVGSTTLYVTELADALRHEKGLDILGYDACLMGSIEVAWEFRSWADVVIASEEKEPNPGWNYLYLFSGMLRKKSGVDVTDVAQLAIDGYDNKYPQNRSLSAIWTSRLDSIASQLTRVSRTAYQEIVNNQSNSRATVEAICEIRSKVASFGLSKPTNADLKDLVSKVETSKQLSSQIVADAKGVKTTLVPAQVIKQSTAPHHASGGFTIFFPHSNDEYKGRLNAYKVTNCAANIAPRPFDFVCQNRDWQSFVEKFVTYRQDNDLCPQDP